MGRGRPLRSEGRQTRQAILDAALELFSEKGYFGTSLRDIARAVGVRESALYNYFAGKDALFSALLEAAREEKTERLAALFEEPVTDVRRLLQRLTALALDTFRDPQQQRLFRVMLSDGMRLAKDGRIDLFERMTSSAAPFHDLMRRLIADWDLRPRDPELLAMQFMGPLLLWRHRHAIYPGGRLIANRAAFIRRHVDHFLHGATHQPARAARSRTKPASRKHVAHRRPPARVAP